MWLDNQTSAMYIISSSSCTLIILLFVVILFPSSVSSPNTIYLDFIAIFANQKHFKISCPFRAFHFYPASIERWFFNLALIALCGSSDGFILIFREIKTIVNKTYFSCIAASLILELATIQTLCVTLLTLRRQ